MNCKHGISFMDCSQCTREVAQSQAAAFVPTGYVPRSTGALPANEANAQNSFAQYNAGLRNVAPSPVKRYAGYWQLGKTAHALRVGMKDRPSWAARCAAVCFLGWIWLDA